MSLSYSTSDSATLTQLAQDLDLILTKRQNRLTNSQSYSTNVITGCNT